MPNENKEREGQDPTAKKASGPNHVYVKIQESDGHYLVSFHHGPPRVFHNTEELLVAIEIEEKRLNR